MPLVVPGLMSKDGSKDKTADWQNQLMGKKLGDTSDHTVRPPSFPLACDPQQCYKPVPPAPKTPLCDLNPVFASLEPVELTWWTRTRPSRSRTSPRKPAW